MNESILKCPLTDTKTNKLPGEKWKDIPGFEDTYQISNYGRTRSLAKNRKILKPHIGRRFFRNGSSVIVGVVQVELWHNLQRYMITVPRMVHHLFNRNFDIRDRQLVVEYKDGNKLNCFYKNLALSGYSEFRKKEYARGSRRSPLQDNIRPVSQFDLKGRLVKSYGSAKDAAEATGVPHPYIYHAAWSETRAAGKFYWRYGKTVSHIDVSRLKQKRVHSLL